MIEKLFPDAGHTARILEYFFVHEQWEQNQKDIIENTGTYKEIARNVLDRLAQYEIIVVTRQIAKSKFYRLNPKSKLLDPLRVLISHFNMVNAELVARAEMEKT